MAKKADTITEQPAAAPVVALLDQIQVAKQELYAVAKSGEVDHPVPDVLARGLDGAAEVLLVKWRAWDIYAVPGNDGWIIRADMVR